MRESRPATTARNVDDRAGGGPRSSGVIWHNTLANAIYDTTEISLVDASLFAGTSLNPPKEVELIALEGAGVPDWVYPGNAFESSASRNAEVLAGVEYDSSTQTATLHKWSPGSSTPDWSHAVSPCVLASKRSVQVSADGARIALHVTMQAATNFVRMFYFDSGSSTPLFTYDPPGATFARNIDLSDDGRYVALYETNLIYVYDGVAGAERYTVSAGASNDALAISGDGMYLAYGWSSLFLRQWTGATYSIVWTRSISGYFLGMTALSSDNSTLFTAWYRSGFNGNRVELHDPLSSTPLWTHLFTPATGGFQEFIADLEVTADGSHAALASWGDQGNNNPEVLVFERASSTPVLGVDTPGTMFAIDIAKAANGTVYVTACGKHVHANQFGRGGDLYSIKIDPLVLGDMNCDAVLDGADIDPFFLALGDPIAYAASFPDCDISAGDVNGDDSFDGADIDAFFDCLGAGCP